MESAAVVVKGFICLTRSTAAGDEVFKDVVGQIVANAANEWAQRLVLPDDLGGRLEVAKLLISALESTMLEDRPANSQDIIEAGRVATEKLDQGYHRERQTAERFAALLDMREPVL